MKKEKTLLLTCFLFSVSFSFAQSSSVIKEYINKYKQIAIEEMLRTGVPASITLAQGIHETEAGRSKLVLKSNNHFGIKCKAEWRGESVSHDDDARGECFRKYADPFDSYKDHSDFLKTRAHYASLFKLDPTDYEGWAHGLKKAGYATNPKYAQVLIKLIRDYNLQDYTLIALGEKQPEENEEVFVNGKTQDETEVVDTKNAAVMQKQNNYPQGVFKINRTNVVFIVIGTSYMVVADEHDISLARLFDFNDLPERETAETDHLVYLQRKRKQSANGLHTVVAGENIWDIAQEEGLRLESLLQYNFLKFGMQPQVGEILYLQRQAPAMPKLFTAQNAINKEIPVEEVKPLEASYELYTLHTVEPKQTMYAISKKYQVAVADILQWNQLQTTELKTGQQLRINKK
jgi:LysM repeat protein